MKRQALCTALGLAASAAMLAAPAAAQADSVFSVSLNGTLLFVVNSDAGAAHFGTFNSSSTHGPPASGAGTRMMWYPEKAAFRAGSISGTQWDDANIGLYSTAAGQDVRASGDNATAFGLRSSAVQVSSFAVGEDNTASGASSVALGYHAHTNARQGSFVFADRSSVDTVRASANHQATFRTSGGFRIFTNSTSTVGVSLNAGGSAWNVVSDRNRKENFLAVDGEDLLARLRRVPVTTWNYIAEGRQVRHMGPVAQDWHAAFGFNEDPLTINQGDFDGVNLAGVQALDARTRAQGETIARQARTIAAQQQTIAAQGRELAELRARLERIEAALAAQGTAPMP